MTGTAAETLVEPAYGERSLADVIPAVAAALGVDDQVLGRAPGGWQLPPAPGYVVFLVDGLGAEQLHQHREWAPFLSAHAPGPDTPPEVTGSGSTTGTAGVPSTTATSLTSLGTALTPGQHGVVGFTVRVPGTGELLNHLAWDAAVDPHTWQPHPTALERLAVSGVTVTQVNQRAFAGSGLTVAGQRGGTFVGADKVGERIAATAAAAATPTSLTYVYDADLDWTGHLSGVGSAAWRQQLVMIDAEAERLREALPPEVGLLVVADHGMVDSPPAARVDVDGHPALRDGVELVGGEARFRHLYCRTGAVADVAATWREQLGDRAVVLTRDEAVARGWFGATDAVVLPRIGDVVVAATGDTAVLDSARFPQEAGLVGLHGSLTAAEMRVPFLLC